MLTNAADRTIPDQSNHNVIIVDEPQEDDEVSQQNRVLGNPFTGPGDVVAGPHGHSNAPPPCQPGGGDDGSGKDGGFCNLVQSLEGMIPISEITEDNDPPSEILSNDSFATPEGSYLVPYIPEKFEGLFLSKPGAPGILTCGYFCTSLRDHPLHFQGHSYTEGSEKVGMYPTRLGLVETGVGYTETICKVRRGNVASTDPYQAYMIAPIVKDGFWYVGVGLIFKPATIGAGHITKCKMFLDSFFSSFGDLPNMEPREVYLLRKCWGVGPLS